LIGSMPASGKLLQSLLLNWPVFWLDGKLSIVSAAQYCRAVQPKPSNCGT
jgi:hypothetical protein